MRRADLYSKPGVVRAKGQVREGLRYVWTTADLRSPLLSMAVVGVFAFNFTVTLPLLAKVTFHGGAGLYSTFLAAMGAGAVLGGLFTAHRSNPSTRLLAVIGVCFGALITAVSLSPTKLAATILLVPMGAASIAFIATNNATLQLRADPAMRGRVMSLNAVAFLGSTPIGATLLGYISDATSPRVALVIGGVATALASVPLFFLAIRQREARAIERGTAAAPRRGVSAVRGAGAPNRDGPWLKAGRSTATGGGPVRSATTPNATTGSVPRIPPRSSTRSWPPAPRTVLDVGCGTGIAARLFTERGCDVLGLEPDPRMAAVARRSGLAVEAGTIEEWDPGERRFDLVTAGQAWHWVDPQRGPDKAAVVLRPGGHFGLFWNQAQPDPSVRPALEAAYALHAPELGRQSVLMGRRDVSLYGSVAQSFRRAGEFDDVAHRRVRPRRRVLGRAVGRPGRHPQRSPHAPAGPAGRAAGGTALADRSGRRPRPGALRDDPGLGSPALSRPRPPTDRAIDASYVGLGSLGSPSTRSPTMFRWISADPPQIVSEREKKKSDWRLLTG